MTTLHDFLPHLQTTGAILLAAACLLSGCFDSKKDTPNPDAIIGIWRGETGGDRANNYVMELTITRIDAGLICIKKSWPKDPTQGIAGELRFPLKQTSAGTWEGEYHGRDGFGYSDIQTIMKVSGNELHEHRITKGPGDPKTWIENWSFKRWNS